MALASVSDCKLYLRIQGSAEDTLLAGILASAIASCEAYLRRPIEAEERTFIIDRPSTSAYRTDHQLFLPIYPVALADSEIDAIGIVDGDGDTIVEDVDFRLDPRTGIILALSDGEAFGHFSTFPYVVTATVGLSADPSYADRIEPAINAAIIDLVADRWHRRSPAATNESTGGGVSSSYDGSGLPNRVKEMLEPFRMARAL